MRSLLAREVIDFSQVPVPHILTQACAVRRCIYLLIVPKSACIVGPAGQMPGGCKDFHSFFMWLEDLFLK